MEPSTSLGDLVVAALISGTVASTIIGIVFKRWITKTEVETKSHRTWKEQSVSELLGPLVIQFNRTDRALSRWHDKNLYLEAEVVRVGNKTIRDLLLSKSHLIPPHLLVHAGNLIEHYDVWLEKFEEQRKKESPERESKFVFAGPDFLFPSKSEEELQKIYVQYWNELYQDA